ncbi:hypothetical protein HOL21_04645 [Candidatus Woesearchaeota archaeon]|jgi:hypothetical protein|nr:hypothetical protein [Candidatus Woesearchaeota archaeon]MBT5397476.1 hypothetical protein [Candidatus Woesearchaeota archaeon]MBT5924625.1 hypothetical protein [Candidatus Woesearchaeota archaeon]MBT6367951.1 hypothetical protein [Candidatus Woesearchaeota archaeon]MBT7763175.1 hypothetical protein [Candidatus Woesearchaeota archaeon]
MAFLGQSTELPSRRIPRKVSRRSLLRKFGIGTLKWGTVLSVGGATGFFARPYLDDTTQKAQPVLEREDGGESLVLCDFHAHIRNDQGDLEDVVEMLGSPGLVGLTQRPDTTELVTYEQAVELVKDLGGFEELTPGQLARFRDGYFTRTEEIDCGGPDILAIGFDGDYLPKYENVFSAIDEIRRRDGISVYTSPYLIAEGKTFRLPTAEEEAKIRFTCGLVDFVEVHNAYSIDYLWFDVKKANELAVKMVDTNCDGLVEPSETPKRFTGSDTHALTHTKLTGMYVREDDLQDMATLKQALRAGDYFSIGDSKLGPYVSEGGFTKTMVLPRIARFFGL